jgi:hypothetical protein
MQPVVRGDSFTVPASAPESTVKKSANASYIVQPMFAEWETNELKT